MNHIKNVLRCQKGEHIEICNSETSKNYLCEINKIEKEEIECNILENLRSNVETDIKVTIFQGLPKADKMEYIIQKSVELGAYDITPVEMKRCIVKLNEKDNHFANGRLVRNLFDDITLNQSKRLSKLKGHISKESLMLITKEDIPQNS